MIRASCFLAAFLTASVAVAAPAADTPNVVMIISDDQAWGDFGFMGHPVIQTPHLDRLASQSLVFTRGYVPSSLCRPSLATLATGLYPHQHRITSNDPPRKRSPKDEFAPPAAAADRQHRAGAHAAADAGRAGLREPSDAASGGKGTTAAAASPPA